MALSAKHKNTKFSVGDRIKVIQRITEGEKKRLQAFEGLLISIKGSEINTSITVRRIGEAQIGIERIFPLFSPVIEKIEVVRKGGRGIRRAKLYYVRDKSKKEVEKVYSRKSKKVKSKTISDTKKASIRKRK